MLNTYSALLPKETRNCFAQFTPPEPKVLVAPQNLMSPNNDIFVSKNKKCLKKGALVAALAIGAGAVYAVKSGKIEYLKAKMLQNKGAALLREADEVCSASKDVFKKAQQSLDEVYNYVLEGAKNGFSDVFDESGNLIRRFSDAAEGSKCEKFMEELGSKGEIVRLTNFDPQTLAVNAIEETMGMTSTRIAGIRCDVDNKIMDCIVGRGCCELPGGATVMRDSFIRRNGLLVQYIKNAGFDSAQSSCVTHKYFAFKHLRLSEAGINVINSGSKTNADKVFTFKPSTGKLVSVDADKEMFFDNINGNKILRCGRTKTKYEFDDVIRVKKAVEIYSNGTEKAAKEIKF